MLFFCVEVFLLVFEDFLNELANMLDRLVPYLLVLVEAQGNEEGRDEVPLEQGEVQVIDADENYFLQNVVNHLEIPLGLV